MIDAQSVGMALEFNVHVGGQLKLFRIFRKKTLSRHLTTTAAAVVLSIGNESVPKITQN